MFFFVSLRTFCVCDCNHYNKYICFFRNPLADGCTLVCIWSHHFANDGYDSCFVQRKEYRFFMLTDYVFDVACLVRNGNNNRNFSNDTTESQAGLMHEIIGY